MASKGYFMCPIFGESDLGEGFEDFEIASQGSVKVLVLLVAFD